MEKLKIFIKGALMNVFFTAILFLCAGKFKFLHGWIFLATNVFATFLNSISINNQDLINERAKINEGAKSWDKKILGLSTLLHLFTIIIAGFDSGRFNWSPEFNLLLYSTGIFLILTGQIIFIIARNQNKFFSAIVRIQNDRGHSVCDYGLYKIIRHQGYLGMIFSLSGLPLILGSLWCIIPVTFAIILLLIRTNLEDKTLIAELKGYSEYIQKTKYKIIPFIW